MKVVIISLNDRWNMGARIMAATFARAGAEVALVNFGEYVHARYEYSEHPPARDSLPALTRIMDHLTPDIVGVSYRSNQASLARIVAERVRSDAADVARHPRIIAGGIGATSDPADAATWADDVCIGEGDLAVHRILAGERLDGLQPLLTDLDAAPFPILLPERVWTISRGVVVHPDGRLDNDGGAYPLLTSRGCPRACSYCHNSTVHSLYAGKQYVRQRSVSNVMEELDAAMAVWPIKLLSIYDDLFLQDAAWVIEFCQALKTHWPARRRFWCMTHPCYVQEPVIAALVDAGLEEICLGVQSGSERILSLYRRGTSIEQIMHAAEVLARHPVAVKIDIISANPQETEADIVDTMRLLQAMPKTDRWKSGLSRLTIFPGSAIGRDVTQAQCLALHGPRQDWIDGMYRAAFVPRWRALDFVTAIQRYGAFERWRDSRTWPPHTGELSDAFWLPLTTWLDAGAPR